MPKRAKRRIRWARIIWLTVGLNLAVGFFTSSITAARTVKVVGALSFDTYRIESELSKLRAVPWARVDQPVVEEKLLFSPEVAAIDLRRNIFGRGRLEMTYRVPVARIDGRTDVALSDDGITFRTRQKIEGLPTVVLQDNERPVATFLGRSPLGKVALLCAAVTSRKSLQGATIEVFSTGSVCLNFRGAARIDFGAIDELESKLKALDKILERDPDLIKRVVELNLMAPDRPAMRDRNP